MITYEIIILDSSFEPFHIGVDSFMKACRLYNSIQLDPEVLYSKELRSHDWQKRISYRIDKEEV